MTPFGLLLTLTLNATAAKATDPAQAELRAAKAARAELKADEKKRKFRHHWQNVARRLEGVAKRHPTSPHAAEALRLAAQTYEELSRLSARPEDLEAARRLYARSPAAEPPARPSAPAAAKKKKGPAAKAQAQVLRIADAFKRLELPELGAGSEGGGPLAPRAVDRGAAEKEAAARDRGERISSDRAAVPRPRAESSAEAEKAAAERAGESAASDRAGAGTAGGPALGVGPRWAFERATDGVAAGDRAPVAEEARPLGAAGGLHVPSVEELAERLRDVRVGEREVSALRGGAKDAELSLAEQLGLKVKRVIIDPGHGGHDTGAVGGQGTREKDVSLKIALKLERLLTEAGLTVLLTRDDDSYVRLEDRAAFANRNRGDLFISVHCNSAPSKSLGGVETYTLNTSSDRYSVRLAARENAFAEAGVGDLQLILADLATKANTEESNRLANRVQHELVRALKDHNPQVRDLGHKEALFFVLLGAKMPAILVEASFLSNPTEERLLGTEAYQLDVAQAIADGVKGFLEERSQVAQVD